MHGDDDEYWLCLSREVRRAWYGAYNIAPEWRVSSVNLEIDCSQAGDHGNLDDCVINYSVVQAMGAYYGDECRDGGVYLACDVEDLVPSVYAFHVDPFDLPMGMHLGEHMEPVTNRCEY